MLGQSGTRVVADEADALLALAARPDIPPDVWPELERRATAVEDWHGALVAAEHVVPVAHTSTPAATSGSLHEPPEAIVPRTFRLYAPAVPKPYVSTTMPYAPGTTLVRVMSDMSDCTPPSSSQASWVPHEAFVRMSTLSEIPVEPSVSIVSVATGTDR